MKVSPRGNYGRQRLTPFARAQSYSNQYPEKGLLVEERTARQLAASVLRHTAGSPDKTLFYDGEGGLCHVAAQVFLHVVVSSVAVPDPQDPYVFGSPESGFGSISTKSGTGSCRSASPKMVTPGS
jgi:hypothetical protein